MIFAIKFQNGKAELVTMAKAEFIETYGEKATTPQGVRNKYFYDADSHRILGWFSGQKVETGNGAEYSVKQAQQVLFELAKDNPDLELSFVCESISELIVCITDYIVDVEDEPELSGSLKQILAEIRC